MVARDLSQRTFPQIGVPEPHHSVSHHGNNPVMIAKLEKINNYHATLLAYLPGTSLRADARWRRQPAGSFDDPVRQLDEQSKRAQSFSAAAAGGRRRIGQIARRPSPEIPRTHADVESLLSLLEKVGIEKGSLGDSTGMLTV